MSIPQTTKTQKHKSISTLNSADLPFHCPPKEASKWNMHPKVFLSFDKDNRAACPYCGASYELKK
jgi:uncharacterized Zn-finger protein